MKTEELFEYISKNCIEYSTNVKLCDFTGMYQEGEIPMVIYPSTVNELVDVCRIAKKLGLTVDVFGGLSNTYLSSSYHKDLVVKTNKIKNVIYKDKTVIVDCGCSLTKISKELSLKGYSGYEGFIGIPGSIGAAAINNSGAFNSSMHKVVKNVTILSKCGNIETLSNAQLKYGTRSSILKGLCDGTVVLTVELKIEDTDGISELSKRIEKIKNYRKKKLDGKRKSLGSCFVATTLVELTKRHKFSLFMKKIIHGILKLFNNSSELNTYLDFLFLGHPELAKHCDSLNRFTWSKDTKESDFFYYINVMQKLSNYNLELEVEIRK